MSTAVTRIQLKYSTGTATPTALNIAEPAYSYTSNTFFIGSPDGNGAIAIGGKFYIDQQQSIFNTANAAFAAANTGAGQMGAYNHANAAFESGNTAATLQSAINSTQNNSITAAFYHANAAFTAANNATDTYVRNHANAAFARANNSVDANNGGTITGDVIINANLFVNGTTTFVNTVNQLIGDNIITLNADLPQGGTPTQDSGIEVERGVQPNSSFLWIESAGKWSANNGNTSFYLNPSIDITTGGSIDGRLGVTGNVYAGNVIANGAVTSTGGTTKLTLSDIGIVAINAGGVETKFNSSGIENQQGIFGGSFGGNKLSLNNETNLISNRYDTVKIQTGDAGTVVNEFTFANNAFTAPGRITAGSTVIGGINVVPQLASAYNHANAAFAAANNATDTYVRNHANAAFDTANSAVAVNVTQNNSITVALNTANAAFAAANSGASSAGAYNHANSSFYHANAAFAQANTYATASASVFNTVGDGTTKTFNLGFTPVSDGSASVVSIDGIIQYEGTWSITTGNTSINFTDAPGNGERIRVLAYTSVNPYVLGPTGVTAGSYGNANTIAVFTTAANGQLTFATNTAIAIGASQITSGELGVTRGGTGAGTFTTNGVLIGQGTSAFTTASSSTEGHVLIINSSGAPVFGYIQGGTF
jgi:hypothetical protein